MSSALSSGVAPCTRNSAAFAVMTANVLTPTTIVKTAMTCPAKVTGEISLAPAVVMVPADHHERVPSERVNASVLADIFRKSEC